VLSTPRLIRFLASLALVGAVVTCSEYHAGDDCGACPAGDTCHFTYLGGPDTDDPCKPSGLACLETPNGRPVCTAAKACKVDSDCPSNLGCSNVDAYDGTTYCATSCRTSCGGSYGCEGCAAGYGCAADGTSCELRLGQSCYVTDTSGPGCGVGSACDAVTRVCTLQPPCMADSDCGGFKCIGEVCMLSCTPDDLVGGDPGIGCAPGFACNLQTFTCSSTLGRPCDPASDDGTQCGTGGACSPASQTCVTTTACNTDADCSGYGCQNGYCLLTCTKNILPCATGLTCDLDTHTCS
jgi:hypothetical protein